MKLTIFLLGSAALAISSSLVSFVLLSPSDMQSLAAILLPVCVTWALTTGELARRVRNAVNNQKDMSAQLMRRDIELGRSSTVDELTGLATRREFDAMIRLEFGRFQRHQHPTSLLMVELDGSDSLGEEVGALTKGLAVAELAAILKQSLRTIDLGCRYTDSTLAMLLLETSPEQARVVTDRIRAAVTEHTFLAQRGNYLLSVSQGVAGIDPSMGSHLDLIHAAEQALVEARICGFDQIAIRTAA